MHKIYHFVRVTNIFVSGDINADVSHFRFTWIGWSMDTTNRFEMNSKEKTWIRHSTSVE